MSMTENVEKTCTKCKVMRDISSFGKDEQKRDGLTSHCRYCRSIASRQCYENNKDLVNSRAKRRYRKIGQTKEYQERRYACHIKRNYGITITEYNNMFIEQAGRCAICGTHQSVLTRRLLVDHCHESDKVRGLLCYNCNTGMGQFGDSLQLLRNVVKYLEMSR